MDDPKGVAVLNNFLFVTDKTKVLRIARNNGKVETLVDAAKFPVPPQFLNDIVIDTESTPAIGTIYVSDSGDRKGAGGAVFRITMPPPPKGKGPAPMGAPKVDLIADAKTIPGLHTPNGLAIR